MVLHTIKEIEYLILQWINYSFRQTYHFMLINHLYRIHLTIVTINHYENVIGAGKIFYNQLMV